MGSEKVSRSGGTATTDLKQCRVCCEPIKAAALKCINCGSYQNWTRHLSRSSALLVSLLALAPLWGLSVSVYKIAFTEKTAQVEAAVTACSYQEVRVAFENSGELSGIVTGIGFSIKQGTETRVPDGEMLNNQGGGDLLIQPDTAPVMVSYRAYIDGEPTNIIPESPAGQGCSYLLDIRWTDFSGSEQQLSRECRCR
jgi:hypothetical protein